MVYIFSVEGNIGSGKSTLVRHLKEKLSSLYFDHPATVGDMGSTQDIVKRSIIYLLEPVDEWLNFKDNDGQKIN